MVATSAAPSGLILLITADPGLRFAPAGATILTPLRGSRRKELFHRETILAGTGTAEV